MRVLIHYRHFPVAMGRYIQWALENLGYQVVSCGMYSGGKIPWGDNFYYPNYKMPPDIVLPDIAEYSLKDVVKDQKFDFIIQAGDVAYLTGKTSCPNIIIATDPHCVDYHPRLKDADVFVSMQKYYLKDYQNGVWLPYGYDENIHKFESQEIKYDVVFCGLQYPHRIATLEKIKEQGLKVYSGLGLIYREFVSKYNEGKIAFNWSSKKDLPARFWEGLAMKRLVLTNRVPDLQEIDLVEDRDYVAFSDETEAIEKAKYYSSHDSEAEKIALSGYEHVRPHTYTNHVKKMLEDVWSQL